MIALYIYPKHLKNHTNKNNYQSRIYKNIRSTAIPNFKFKRKKKRHILVNKKCFLIFMIIHNFQFI